MFTLQEMEDAEQLAFSKGILCGWRGVINGYIKVFPALAAFGGVWSLLSYKYYCETQSHEIAVEENRKAVDLWEKARAAGIARRKAVAEIV